MKKTLYLLMMLYVAVACSPKNEEVQEEQVKVAPPAKALDSIADTEKDGLITAEIDLNATLPVPQPVLQLLAEKYQEWEKPTLTEEALEQAENHPQAPMTVRGDFDGDTRQDLALQLQEGDDLVIVAALQEQDGTYKLYELKRDIMFNERGTLKSLYYVYLVEQGDTLRNEEENGDIEAAHDAVAVGIEGEAVVYLYEGGTFSPYSVRS